MPWIDISNRIGGHRGEYDWQCSDCGNVEWFPYSENPNRQNYQCHKCANADNLIKSIEMCECGIKAATLCPGKFEQGCDLGANANFVKVTDVAMTNQINAILSERGSRYGKFSTHAAITQSLKCVMEQTPKWSMLSAAQKEALEMTAHKIGRILNGDPNYTDSWVDIVGYNQLVVNILNGEEK